MRLIAVALLLVWTCAYSQAPQQGKGQPSASQGGAAKDQRGTEQAPVVIKMVEPSKAEREAAAKKAEAKDKLDADLVRFTDLLAKYTKDLANYTLALVGLGLLQFFALIFTIRATKAIASGEENRTKLLERAYVFGTPKPLSDTEDSLEIVSGGSARRIVLDGDGPGGYIGLGETRPGAANIDGTPVGRKMRLRAQNLGKTPAVLTHIQWTVRPLTGLPQVPEYGADMAIYSPVAGGQTVWTKAETLSYRLDWQEPHVAFGRIRYEDVFGSPHTVGFLYRIEHVQPFGFLHHAVDGFPEYTKRD